MPKDAGDAKLLFQSLNKAYAATPTNLKAIAILSRVAVNLWPQSDYLIADPILTFLQIIDLYVVFAMATALVQVIFRCFTFYRGYVILGWRS